MQSSPPVRAWDRPESAQSQYSVDFAALEQNSRSGASSPALPEPQLDRVLSEDIDGPSDFTQNLEKWMRGGTMNSKFGSMRSGLNTVHERTTNTGDGLNPFVQGTVGDGGDDEHSASHHTPTNSPPKESVFASSKQSGADEEGSSGWDPYVEDATPPPPPHIHLLQPTVEDYYSELTPARPTSRHTSQAQQLHSNIDIQDNNGLHEHSQLSTPGRPSSEVISPVRSPVRSPLMERSIPRYFSSQTDEATFERQIQELHEKCQRLEHLNGALSRAIDEERRARREEQATHQAKSVEVSRRERDLANMMTGESESKKDVQREFGDIQQRLRSREGEIKRMKHNHATEIQMFKQQIEQEREEHASEVRALEQDLELAQHGRDDANELARMAREEYDVIREDRDANVLKASNLQTHASELEDQLRFAVQEGEEWKSTQKGKDETANNIRAELLLLKQSQQEETARLVGDHRRAVNMAEDLQSQLKALQQQLHDQQEAHRVELERFQTSPPTPPVQNTAGIDDIRAELDTKQAALNTAILERDALQDDLNFVQAELEALKLDLSDRDAVNLDLDARVCGMLRRREAYWREKLEDAEQERKIMVKALLRQWGREEVGIADDLKGELQEYEYLFRERKA